MIDKFKIDPRAKQLFAKIECGTLREVAVESGFIRRDGIDNADIAHKRALTQHVGQPFKVLQEGLHVLPIRHTEVETGRCPFPVRTIGAVVKSMQIQERRAVQIIFARSEHELF